MVVLVVERVPDGLRGSLRRWMIEVQAGVFVGRLSQRVHQEIWARVQRESAAGAAVLIRSNRSEQGYAIEVHGQPGRAIIDMEGLYLVARPKTSSDADARSRSTRRHQATRRRDSNRSR